MADNTDITQWLEAMRASQDHLASIVAPLDQAALRTQSYDTEWTIAEVLSHLGSQAEIFNLFIDAAASGAPTPGAEQFAPVWERWNALPPEEQAAGALAAGAAIIERFEALADDESTSLTLDFAGMTLDLAGVASLRTPEHVIHTWDVEVALDPAATLNPAGVPLIASVLSQRAGRFAKTVPGPFTLAVQTSDPELAWTITAADAVALTEGADAAETDAELQLPTEAFIRLLYGRLDEAHTPADIAISGPVTLDQLRATFPGF